MYTTNSSLKIHHTQTMHAIGVLCEVLVFVIRTALCYSKRTSAHALKGMAMVNEGQAQGRHSTRSADVWIFLSLWPFNIRLLKQSVMQDSDAQYSRFNVLGLVHW